MSKTRNLGNLTDLLTAGSIYVTTNTPSQFDNSQNLATTASIKNNGLSLSTATSINASRNLVAADIGSHLLFNSTSTLTIPTPTSLGARAGDAVVIGAYGGNTGTVAFSGCTYIYGTSGLSASLTILNGEQLVLIVESTTTWRIGPSTSSLGQIGSFGSLVSSAGYQKLPSGIILQWSTGLTNSSGQIVQSLPITFPGGWFIGLATTEQPGNYTVSVASLVSNSITIDGYIASSGAAVSAGLAVSWLAIGY